MLLHSREINQVGNVSCWLVGQRIVGGVEVDDCYLAVGNGGQKLMDAAAIGSFARSWRAHHQLPKGHGSRSTHCRLWTQHAMVLLRHRL